VKVHPSNGDIYFLGNNIQGPAFPPNSQNNAGQSNCGGNFRCAFVFRFNTALTAVTGGTSYGYGATSSVIPRDYNHMAINATSGDVYIGLDAGAGMPNTTGSFQPSLPSGNSTPSVVVHISGDLATIGRAAYVVGATAAGDVRVRALAVQPLNTDFYFGGSTGNQTLPNTTGGAQPGHAGSEVGFLFHVTADLAAGTGSPGVLQFSSTNYSRNENGGVANITVTRTGGSVGAVAAQYAATSGAAQAGSEFTATNGTFNWAAGDANSKSCDVAILDDSAVEPAETASLTLSSASGGAALGTQSPATLQINDNDVALPATPGIGVSSNALTFAATTVGNTSAAQSLTITSNGTASLQVSTVTLDGANANEFALSSNSCSNQTLTPNATCTVQVTFTPSAAGARSATLLFTSNAAGSPRVVNLSGTGNSPPLAASTAADQRRSRASRRWRRT
jgi:hypothetical protein